MDAASAQFFVNSSLASVRLFRRRIKSVADVLKGIRHHGIGTGVRCAAGFHADQSFSWSLGFIGFSLICTAFKNGF